MYAEGCLPQQAALRRAASLVVPDSSLAPGTQIHSGRRTSYCRYAVQTGGGGAQVCGPPSSKDNLWGASCQPGNCTHH